MASSFAPLVIVGGDPGGGSIAGWFTQTFCRAALTCPSLHLYDLEDSAIHRNGYLFDEREQYWMRVLGSKANGLNT